MSARVDGEGDRGAPAGGSAVGGSGAGGVRWFDTHCHVQDEPEVEVLLAAAAAAGVRALVCVGTDVESSRRAVELATVHGATAPVSPAPVSPAPVSPAAVSPAPDAPAPVGVAGQDGAAVQIWATVGLHPHDAARTGAEGIDGVSELLDSIAEARVSGGAGQARAVAVGECGLDYHYDFSPRPDQRRAFAAQVALARVHGLTLVIHTREAWDDTFAVLASEGVPERTVFHCFTGGPEEARRCLELGAWLSFSGIVSFKGADEVRAAAALCPAERLVVETDAPFLAPVPHRGARNTPAFVGDVGAAVAAARGVSVAEVASGSWAAAEEAFGLGRA